jgi:hypothetical protein
MMSFPNDDELNRFRADSDKAFLVMQANADKEMANFLKSYSENAVMGSFQTPDMSWGVAPIPVVRTVGAAVRRKVKQAADSGGKAVDKMTGGRLSKLKGAAGQAAHQTLDEFGDAIQEDLEATAQSAVADAKGWLKSATMDLGERARREAAAMRDAARKAMQEETSLRGLKERAGAELEAAKKRMKAELADVQADAVADLEGIAMNKLGEAQEHGFAAVEAAQKKASLELDDLWGGGGKPR